VTDRTNGVIRSFAAAESPCQCPGTPHKETGLLVLPVKWKLTGKNISGKIRFRCGRCNHRWSMMNVPWANGEMVLEAIR
jgi:hypothetical protein